MGPYGVIFDTWDDVQGEPEVVGIFLNRERAEAWAATVPMATRCGVFPWSGSGVVVYTPLDHLAEGVTFHILEDLWEAAWQSAQQDSDYQKTRREKLKTLWETWKGAGLVDGEPWQA
jgi:hypothetical protein